MIEKKANYNYFRIGSMVCRVQEETTLYAQILSNCYSAEVLEGYAGSFSDLILSIEEKPEKIENVTDKFIVDKTKEGYLIETDPIICTVICQETSQGDKFIQAEITIQQPDMEDTLIGYHLWIIVNRMLLMLDAIIIHAAAIELDGFLNVFCGHKGAGKSTLSVFLGQKGGKVLAEDRIILRRKKSEFLVSGCSSKVKIMEKSEKYLLPDQLHMERTLVSNISKKIFDGKDFFSAIPHEDIPPKRIIFNQVIDGDYHFNDIKPNEAMLKMIDRTADIYRFSNREDYSSFLNLIADFIKKTDCYLLHLSTDIEKLPLLLDSLHKIDNT